MGLYVWALCPLFNLSNTGIIHKWSRRGYYIGITVIQSQSLDIEVQVGQTEIWVNQQWTFYCLMLIATQQILWPDKIRLAEKKFQHNSVGLGIFGTNGSKNRVISDDKETKMSVGQVAFEVFIVF